MTIRRGFTFRSAKWNHYCAKVKKSGRPTIEMWVLFADIYCILFMFILLEFEIIWTKQDIFQWKIHLLFLFTVHTVHTTYLISILIAAIHAGDWLSTAIEYEWHWDYSRWNDVHQQTADCYGEFLLFRFKEKDGKKNYFDKSFLKLTLLYTLPVRMHVSGFISHIHTKVWYKYSNIIVF